MSNTTADNQLVKLLIEYAAGAVSAESLRDYLEAPGLRAALHALVGKSLTTPQGDQITIGDIANAKGIAVGAGALAIGEIVVHIVRNDAALKIDNTLANQGAQGVFHGPVTINYGVPATTPAAQPSRSVSALKRSALERRIAALTEEYTAINSQIDATIDAAMRLRLQRRADDLLAEIDRYQAEL